MHPLLADSALDGAPCGFVSFDDSGTMLAVNHTLAAMLGYSRVELEGWHLQKLLPAGGRIFYNTHVFPLLKMHGLVEEVYIALRTKDGADVPVLMNAVRRERDGRFVSDCVFVRMLQRHAYEDQLLQARRLAEQAADAKTKFLSMMSHDLRTPLTAISGLSELLITGFHGDLSDDQQQEVRHIREAARELAKLLDDILSFAQLDSGKVTVRLSSVAVCDAIARAESLLRFRIEQTGVAFDSQCSTSDVVHADPDRLQQILLNLLNNALKFTASGGRISVSSEKREERVLIHVRDTGIGIPADQIERIFEPFVQLDSSVRNELHRGVGLGLSITRDLARAMGGSITVASETGRGSVFTIELPAG